MTTHSQNTPASIDTIPADDAPATVRRPRFSWKYLLAGYLFSLIAGALFPGIAIYWAFVILTALLLRKAAPTAHALSFALGQFARIIILTLFIWYAWHDDVTFTERDTIRYIWIGNEVSYIIDAAKDYRGNTPQKQKQISKYPIPFSFLQWTTFGQ